MIKTTSIAITIYTLLLIGSNGSLTATATATTKANYSLVSYMAPIKLEIQDGGIWICNGLLCPANAYGCRFVRRNYPEQLQSLWATDTCLDRKGQVLIENGYTMANPIQRRIDIDVKTYANAKNAYCSIYNINTEMVKGSIAPDDWHSVMYEAALKTASIIYLAQNNAHVNEISVIKTINVTYDNDTDIWTCNGIKCPKQTYGCHILRKTSPENESLLNMVDTCFDKNKQKLMSRIANMNMGTERYIDIDLESYLGAFSRYTIDTFYDNELAKGVISPNGWQKFFRKFEIDAINRFPLLKKSVKLTPSIPSK